MASAQNTANDGPLAGIEIKNIAQMTYTSPATGSDVALLSNPVTTTVLPKPAFDIVYLSGNDGLGSTTPAGNTPMTASTAPGDSAVGLAAAGTTFSTPYIAVNNGNTVQTISLTSSSAGALAPASVQYYADSNKNGILDADELSAGPTTTISLPYDDPATTADEGMAYFIQVMTLPSTAVSGQIYAATPVGTGQVYNSSTGQVETVTESTTVPGLQYARVTVPNQPPVPADVTNPMLNNTAGPTPISPLVATDDSAVAGFIIQTLPDPASGVLYYEGQPVTEGQFIANPAGLSFDPAPGSVGNATFDYIAIDDSDASSTTNRHADGSVTDGPATYTIPVQAAPSTDLVVEKTNTAPSTNGWTDLPSDSVRLGTTTSYWIRVTNNGPAPVTGAVLTDQLFADGLSLGTTACSSNGSTGTNLCTTTNTPTAAQLTSGYILPTIGVGQFFEFYVSVNISSIPTGPTAGVISNTATVTIPSSTGPTTATPPPATWW